MAHRAATPVASGSLRPGDLLFYRTTGSRVSHVGIYVGDRKFIHAPNAKGTVRFASIDDRFWSKRFAGAGRFTAP
ncbi:MAG: NlpC/P60 family protein [Pseudomonadota bacterium]